MVDIRRKIQEILFVIVEWLVWISLIIGAIVFVNEVFLQYASESTSIKISTKMMQQIENPAITLCFQPFAKYSELSSLNISIFEFMNFEVPLKNLRMIWPEFYHRITYQIGKDFHIWLSLNDDTFFLIDKISLTKPYSDYVDLEEIYTLFTGLCYKLTPKIKTSNGLQTTIHLSFNESMPKQDIPRRIEMFLTSEENSYGIISSQWNAGDVFHLNIRPFEKSRYKIQLVLQEHEKLKWTSSCSDGGSYISRLSTRYF